VPNERQDTRYIAEGSRRRTKVVTPRASFTRYLEKGSTKRA
jgi:hypothetical protein